MTLMYTIYNSAEGAGANLIFSDGTVQTVDASNPHYAEVKRILTTEDPESIDEDNLRNLLTPAVAVSESLTRLSERVTFDGANILFDGDVFNNAIAEHILRILNEGGNTDSYAALVAFLEKLYQNPSEASRESLYDFIVRYGITIDPDGDFYVYKGVRRDGTSIHSGFGIVNGQVYKNDHLPNNPGAIVEMPRSKVDADTARGCSTGLHAGTYSYASGFSQGMLLTVKVNPRDVVSVPAHCEFQKIRVSRYKVITQTEVEITNTIHSFLSDEPDHNIDTVENLLESYGEVEVGFTYTRGNGEKITVRDFSVLEVQRNNQTGDVLLVGEDANGNDRTYRSDFISDLHIDEALMDEAYGDNYDDFADDDDLDDDDLDFYMNHDVSDNYGDEDQEELDAIDDEHLDNDDVETIDILIHRVNHGEQVRVDFDYLTVAGDARTLRNFLVTETRNNNTLIVGVRDEDNEVRSYRADRISGLYVRS